MENSIIRFEELDKHKDCLGSKTLKLQKCINWGFMVPKFVALPSRICRRLLEDGNFRNKVTEEAIGVLRVERYAVRSSALIEDGKNESMSGQFLTKVDVDEEGLAGSIYEVLRQSETILGDKMEIFSLIIQEYITADISGVAFTRNPNGGREMVLEYGFCEGEKIVGGKIKPEETSFYWSQPAPSDLPDSFLKGEIIEKFKDLEKRSAFPQDIEWCIKDDVFYILQTRPITTISERQYEQIVFLESVLPRDEKYLFEKTEISEIAPDPSNITLGLLRLIYGKDGPVERTYRKYGVVYKDKDFLKIIGNELYVDREKEIRGLLPAYSYLGNKNFDPRFSGMSGVPGTLRNLIFLNRIKTGAYKDIFERLKTKIESPENEGQTLGESIKNFLRDYESVFEINLLSCLSIKKLSLFLKNEPVNFPKIIGASSLFVDLKEYHVENAKNLDGNSLEVGDMSVFVAGSNGEGAVNDKVDTWWGKVPEYRRRFLREKIIEAIVYDRLRELGRWLTVKNINAIRKVLFGIAQKNGFREKENIFFIDLADILDGAISEKMAIDCRGSRSRYEDYCFPGRITSSLAEKRSVLSGVSSGMASGTLRDRGMMEGDISMDKKIILYTDILSPDLTKYFDKIGGIVSDNGGTLSHLAIMAREKKLPVVVGFSMFEYGIKLGDRVMIDGGSGKITKIDDSADDMC